MSKEFTSEIKNLYKHLNTISKPKEVNLQLEFVNQIASLFSPGNYYYYILNFVNLEFVYVHHNIDSVLGIKPIEFTFDSCFQLLHPDDRNAFTQKESIAGNFLLNKINPEDITKYKVTYLLRLRHTNGIYKTILHQARALSTSKDNKIQYVLAAHIDISHLNPILDHNISLISDILPSYYVTNIGSDYKLIELKLKSLFTKREKEVIYYIAKGLAAKEIANKLHLSLYTINTHKRNILKKSECKNTAELITRCFREGII
jgi:DNA-binding CsgD family transcriptional regulator